MDDAAGEPERLPDRQIRLSDAERSAVVDQLQTAAADGRLDMEEFQDRVRLAYAARYQADLVPITTDLPVVSTRPVQAGPPAGKKRKRRWMVHVMGGSNSTGAWDPRDGIVSLTLMGGQTLDLTEVAATNVEITAVTIMGGTEIIVPDGAAVDLGGFMLFGGSSNDANRQGDSVMRVRVRAVGAMGGCEVRNLSDKEKAKRARR